MTGNINKVRGTPESCTAPTLVRDNRPVVAAMHLPTTGESHTARHRADLRGTPQRSAADHRPHTAAWTILAPSDPQIRAVILAELYRHAQHEQPVWKLRAVGQGRAEDSLRRPAPTGSTSHRSDRSHTTPTQHQVRLTAGAQCRILADVRGSSLQVVTGRLP